MELARPCQQEIQLFGALEHTSQKCSTALKVIRSEAVVSINNGVDTLLGNYPIERCAIKLGFFQNGKVQRLTRDITVSIKL